MTWAAILLHQRLTLPYAGFGFSKQTFRSAKAFEAVPGANQRWIEEKC
jgi:hypothetical protein